MDWVRWTVGLCSWVQGFRCFPWLGVSFFLKDGLRVESSALQILQNSANIPMVFKPLFGILSDALPIAGQRRLPYLAIGALLQTISWLLVALLADSNISIFTLTLFLLLGNLGASVAEVANDAIVAEAAKSSSSSGNLQSFACMFAASAGALGNLLGGIAINELSPKIMFIFFSFILLLQFFATITIPEHSLNLPPKAGHSSKSSGISKQLSELSVAFSKPEIFYSILWFSLSYAMVPLLLGTMFFFQTEQLNLNSSVIGFSKVFGQGALLVWSVAYDKHFKQIPARKLLSALQVTIALFIVSDMFFVKGFYRGMGISDTVYVVIFSGLSEALLQFKFLPFSVLMAQICPSGCEGSVMAFLMSASALAIIVSGYLGVALASFVGVSASDFSGLTIGLVIEAACSLLPLYWLSWIPDISRQAKKNE